MKSETLFFLILPLPLQHLWTLIDVTEIPTPSLVMPAPCFPKKIDVTEIPNPLLALHPVSRQPFLNCQKCPPMRCSLIRTSLA